MFSGLNTAIFGINTLISGHKIEEDFHNRGIPLYRIFLSFNFCTAKPENNQTKIFSRKISSSDTQITNAELAKNSSKSISLPLESTSLTDLESLRHANVKNSKQKNVTIEMTKQAIKHGVYFVINGLLIPTAIEQSLFYSSFSNKVFSPVIIGATCGSLSAIASHNGFRSIDYILKAYAHYIKNNNFHYKYAPTLDSVTGGVNPTVKLIITASLLEEIFFRGICSKITNNIFHEVLKKAGADNIASKASIVSRTSASLGFGLVHLRNPKPSLYQAILAIITGFIFESLNYNYGLLASISAHLAFNAYGYIYRDQYL